VAALAEALPLIKGLLSGETASASGPRYAAASAEVSPRPVQHPHPPILIAGSGRRLLSLAAREADIVALGVAPAETEAGVAERIAWLQEAAGPRFGQLELNMTLMAVGDQLPAWVSRQLGLTAEVLASSGAASALLGSVDEMCETLLRRREALGVSYVAVSDEMMEKLAPVVERLAGR
jgi:alkanesulfonate monooxygenase SsuD/methylene tetrahydromethanopterin reductase-like flavin-dependent oxidoreductase (luciferase family)